jgi:hypothetical protein
MRCRGRSNGRRSPRSCTCAPARRPSCACACRPILYGTRTALYLPFPDLYNTTRALASTCTRLLLLVQNLPSRRGSRAPRDWALREVKVGRRVPPPPPVSIRITTTGTTVYKQESLPCLMFLGPLPILWILVLGRVRFVSRGHGGEALVSFRFRPLFLSASGPATRSASPSIYGIDFLCYFSEMAQTLRGVDNGHSCTRGRGG